MSTATAETRIHVRLDEIKAEKGIKTDAEFARVTGVHPRTISDIRNGRQFTFGIEDKIKLHCTLGLSMNDIEEFIPA